MKYIKKPVVIDAFQFTENYPDDAPGWGIMDEKICFSNTNGNVLYIATLEGSMMAHPGDYIIRGVEGEVYPCKENIFKKTYDIYDD